MRKEKRQIEDWINANHYLTVAQVAAFLQVSQTTVRRMVGKGLVNYRRVGNCIRFSRRDIKKFDESVAFRPDARSDSSDGGKNS